VLRYESGCDGDSGRHVGWRGWGQNVGRMVANRLSFGVLESAVKLSSHILSTSLPGPKVVIIQCFVSANRLLWPVCA